MNACAIKPCVGKDDNGNPIYSKLFDDLLYYFGKNHRDLAVKWYGRLTLPRFVEDNLLIGDFDENGELKFHSAKALRPDMDVYAEVAIENLEKEYLRIDGHEATTFEQAIDLAEQFNNNNDTFNKDYVAVVTKEQLHEWDDNKSQYRVHLSKRENLAAMEQSRETIRTTELQNKMLDLLQSYGINVSFVNNPAYKGKFTTQRVDQTMDALWNLISISTSNKNEYELDEAMAEACGQFAVAALEENDLVKRAKEILTDNVVAALVKKYKLNPENYNNAETLLGYLVGQHILSKLQKEKDSQLNALGRFCSRIWAKIKSVIKHINPRKISQIRKEAEELADKIAVGFVEKSEDISADEALKQDITRYAINNVQGETDAKKVIKGVATHLSHLIEQVKKVQSDDKSGKIGYTLSELRKLRGKALDAYRSGNMSEKEMQTFITNSIIEILQSLYNQLSADESLIVDALDEDSLRQALADPDHFIENMGAIGRKIFIASQMLEHLESILSVTANDGFIKTLQQFTQVDGVSLQQMNGRLQKLLIDKSDLVRNAQLTFFQRFLEDFYSARYIQESTHIVFRPLSEGGAFQKIDPKQYSIQNMLTEYREVGLFGVPFSFFTSASNSNDYILQIANMYAKSGKKRIQDHDNEAWQALDNLRYKLSKINRSHGGHSDRCDVFYERDENGQLTGNLISQWHWGQWEQDRQEFKNKIFALWKELYPNLKDASSEERSSSWQAFFKTFNSAWNKGTYDQQLDKNGNPVGTSSVFTYLDDEGNTVIASTDVLKESDFRALVDTIKKLGLWGEQDGFYVQYDEDNNAYSLCYSFRTHSKWDMMTEPNGNPIAERDDEGNIIYETDKDGNPVYEYDDEGNPHQKVVPDYDYRPSDIYEDEDYNGLNNEEKEWLQEYMQWKYELESTYLLPGTASLIRAPQFRGRFINKLRNYQKANGNIRGSWEAMRHIPPTAFKNIFVEDAEDTDYGSYWHYQNGEDLFGDYDSQFLENVERIPLYGIERLKDTRMLSTDLLGKSLAYADMAHSYHEAYNMLGVLETGRSVINRRKAHWFANWRFSKLVDKFVYGKNQWFAFAEKVSRRKRMTITKTTNWLQKMASLVFLGGNVHSATANALMGLSEIFREAVVGHYFNLKDFSVAMAQYAGVVSLTEGERRFWGQDGIELHPGKSIKSNDVLSMMIRKFDILGDVQDRNRNWNTRSTQMTILASRLAWMPYHVADHFMQVVPFLMVANNTFVYDKEGNKIKFMDLYEVRYDDNGRRMLAIKEEYMPDRDQEGNYLAPKIFFNKLTAEDDEALSECVDAIDTAVYDEDTGLTECKKDYKDLLTKTGLLDAPNLSYIHDKLMMIRKHNALTDEESVMYMELGLKIRAREITNQMHGIYNTEDKTLAQSIAAGNILSSMKGYAYGMIIRRFGGHKYNAALGEETVGSMRAGLVMNLYYLSNFFKQPGHGLFSLLTAAGTMSANVAYFMPGVSSLLPSTVLFVTQLAAYGYTFLNHDKLRRDGFSEAQIIAARRCAVDYMGIAVTKLLNIMLSGMLASGDGDDDGDYSDLDPNECFLDKNGKIIFIKGKPMFKSKYEADPDNPNRPMIDKQGKYVKKKEEGIPRNTIRDAEWWTAVAYYFTNRLDYEQSVFNMVPAMSSEYQTLFNFTPVTAKGIGRVFELVTLGLGTLWFVKRPGLIVDGDPISINDKPSAENCYTHNGEVIYIKGVPMYKSLYEPDPDDPNRPKIDKEGHYVKRETSTVDDVIGEYYYMQNGKGYSKGDSKFWHQLYGVLPYIRTMQAMNIDDDGLFHAIRRFSKWATGTEIGSKEPKELTEDFRYVNRISKF